MKKSMQTATTILLLTACTEENRATEGDNAATPLQTAIEPGPYNIGHRAVEAKYDDPLGQAVSVPVDIWYPTEDTDGVAAAYLGTIKDDAAWSDATLASPAHRDGHPVLVFSHGSNLYGASSAFLMRHFASHGWIAVAPTHVGNTITDLDDGDCDTDAYGCRTQAVWLQRPLNTMAALEQVAAALGDSPEVDSVVLAGFSYGAYDTWARAGGAIDRESVSSACDSGGISGGCTDAGITAMSRDFFDERISAIIPMAGAHAYPFGATGLDGITIPGLMMSGTLDADDPGWVWEHSVNTPLTWLSIEGACHGLWSFGGCAEVDTSEGHQAIASYALAFARAHLLNDASEETLGLLDGSIQPWSWVSLRSR